MKIHKRHSFLKYLVFIIFVLYIARFIFTGQTAELTSAFKPFVYACVFIYLFGPIAKFIQRKTKFNRLTSVILAYLFFILLIAFFIVMIVPSIIDSVQMLIESSSSYNEDELITFFQSIPLLSNFVETSSLSAFLRNLETLVVEYSSNILTYSTGILSSIGSFLASLVVFLLALFMSFVALKDSDNIEERAEIIIKAFFSEKISTQIIRIAKLTNDALKKYLVGKLYACFILSILVAISISLVNIITNLDIPYFVLIALIVGITNIIPFIGGLIGTIPSVIIALFSGFWEAVAVFLIILVIQQVDNIIISPKIIGDSVGVKPFWVIGSITVGGSLFGAIGMIIAAPITSVILYLVDEKIDTYKARTLEITKEIESPDES